MKKRVARKKNRRKVALSRRAFFGRTEDTKKGRRYRDDRGRFISRKKFYKARGLSSKKSKVRKRKKVLTLGRGWRPIKEFKNWLETKYPGIIYSEVLPSHLKFFNTENGEAYLSHNKKMPSEGEVFRLGSIWLVVQNIKTGDTYFMIQTKLLAPTITGERLFDVAHGMAKERSEKIEQKTDYLSVREWVAWTGGRN